MKTFHPAILSTYGEDLHKAGYGVAIIAELLRKNSVEQSDVEDGQPFLNARTEDGLIAVLEVLGGVVGKIGELLSVADETGDSHDD